MASKRAEIKLGTNDDGRRLDRVVKKLLPTFPAGRIYRAFRNGDIRLNSQKAKPEDRAADGDCLQLRGPVAGEYTRAQSVAAPSPAIDSLSAGEVVHRNEHVLVLNKQRGDLMHGVNSLEERVREFYQREVHIKTSGVSFRPGPVHRLDRNTSGLVMFGMSTRGAQEASELIAHNQIEKSYLALLSGSLASRQRWTDPIRRDRTAKISRAVAGGADAQPAESEAIPLISSSRATLALVQIYGGRTHQIRVHASAHGHPLLGDKKYGGQTINGYGYLLHAAKLRLPEGHPVLGFACVWAPLPQAARQLLESYFQHTEVVHAIKSVECHSPRD